MGNRNSLVEILPGLRSFCTEATRIIHLSLAPHNLMSQLMSQTSLGKETTGAAEDLIDGGRSAMALLRTPRSRARNPDRRGVAHYDSLADAALITAASHSCSRLTPHLTVSGRSCRAQEFLYDVVFSDMRLTD